MEHGGPNPAPHPNDPYARFRAGGAGAFRTISGAYAGWSSRPSLWQRILATIVLLILVGLGAVLLVVGLAVGAVLVVVLGVVLGLRALWNRVTSSTTAPPSEGLDTMRDNVRVIRRDSGA